MDFKNRGAMGSGHGWGMGWAVAWNCVAKTMSSSNRRARSTGDRLHRRRRADGAAFRQDPNCTEGTFDSPGKPVTPQSLYLTQLAERLGRKP